MIDVTLLPRVVAACIAAAAVCGAIAGFYLLPEKKTIFTVFYSRPKTDFRGRGWQLRQASVYFGYLAFSIAIVYWVVKK
jgi:hypothetical protein